MNNSLEFIAVVLAAGRGKRIQATVVNKTAMKLVEKPMVGYTLGLLKKAGLKKIIIVVGFAKDSIINYFGKNDFIWAIQKKQLGTAHAVKTALEKIPVNIKNVLVIQGDDSAFYIPEIIKNLIKKHQQNDAALTFLTVKVKKPTVGRIIRDKKGDLKDIVEVKNATTKQLKIKEINAGCYCFRRNFLTKYLNQVKKDSVSKEYYLPDLIKIGLKAGEKIKAIKIPAHYFQSINTPEELETAQILMQKKLNV